LLSARNASVAFNPWSFKTMHKPLNVAERAKLQLADVAPVLSRREKLLRLAEIARKGRPSFLTTVLAKLAWDKYYARQWYIFHRVEFAPKDALKTMSSPASVFDAALSDAVLYDAGLRPDHGESVSVANAMQFFELTQTQMHPMSCDCGGAISNEEMARRIENMAA
jgi:hypothetical protein